jgi:two-component system chemotaxis sensor kinase CheA
MRYFSLEARELLEKLSQHTLDFERSRSEELLSALLRHAHTLKGAARVVRQAQIAQTVHKFEELLGGYRGRAETFPDAEVDQLLRWLDDIAAALASLGQPASAQPPAVPEAPSATAPQAAAPPDAAPARAGPQDSAAGASAEEGGLSVLTHQGLEVDGLLEDLRAANSQLEVLRRDLQTVERGKALSELLLAQLSGDRPAPSARFVAEELQSELRGVERSLAFAMDQIERELDQVRESTERLRLVRAGILFPILRRVVRDAALELGLRAELETQGGDLRLDPQLLTSIQGALIQAVRNSLAHGIEPSEQRSAAGKPAQGAVLLAVSRRGGRVVFRCRDDGRGIDLPSVRARLQEQGLAAGELSDQAVLELLLRGGVSTSKVATQAAGHGIGLDLIRDTAARLGGEMRLASEPGGFTEIVLEVPWTLAGMDFLQLVVHPESRRSVLLPMESVRGALHLSEQDISREANRESVLFEGQAVRLVALGWLLGQTGTAAAGECKTALVVEGTQGRMALATGSLQGTRTATLLPLPPWSQASDMVAGAALNADGDPQLVLDADGLLLAALRSRFAQADADSEPMSARLLVIDDSLTTRMLQQSILESSGFEVELASSAEEGLEKVRQDSYGLILVDVDMPGMNGFEFLEVLRADPRLASVPAIMVTSRDAAEDRARAKSVGAQGYMVKSEFDQTALLQQIRSLLT